MRTVLPAGAEPCLWMSAGVLTYRLCDRGFDCEHCPLDAALRGETSTGPAGRGARIPRRWTEDFPEDRRYTKAHGWLQGVSRGAGGALRFGLDAFAASILGRCEGVSWRVPRGPVPAGETICALDVGAGTLCIASPLAAEVLAVNEELGRDPESLLSAPYLDGWLAELLPREEPPPGKWLTGAGARERAKLDAQHFRRRVAMHLLAYEGCVGRTMADGGELTDLGRMLGGTVWLDLVRELIH